MKYPVLLLAGRDANRRELLRDQRNNGKSGRDFNEAIKNLGS